MNNSLAVICLLVAIVALSFGQDVPGLNAKNLSGAKILKSDSYAGKALFGYIDGGAELYLEYGFKKLGRQEVLYSNEKFIVEVYQMAGPNEAYGVFSVQRFKCVPVDTMLPNTCLSKYQLQAVVGDCYLSIINESGSEAAQRGSVALLRALMSNLNPQAPKWPSIFSDEKLKPHMNGLVVAYGHLGLQNGYSEWVPLFESFENFTVMVVPISVGEEHLAIAYVNISCCGEIDEFCRLVGFDRKPGEELMSLTIDGSNYVARQIGKQVLLLAVSSPSFPGLASYVDLLSK